MKMNTNHSKTLIAVLAAIAVLGIGTYAFAGRGWGHHGEYGYGHHMYGHHNDYGPSGDDGDDYGPVRGYRGDLPREESEQLDKERDAFYQATEKLRGDLYQKELALRSELAKENPDSDTAAKLQKEISDLRADLDQKRIDHLIKLRKVAPNAGRGWGGGYGPGGGYCGR
ncbi:MAG: periplasmic heavy metal sensor [Proteobacteria bacterium]|nr:periplasmic heavy metal sensor [Pseudomonadota bacterium]